MLVVVQFEKDLNHILKLIVFMAKKMFLAECNYEIYNKKLFASI